MKLVPAATKLSTKLFAEQATVAQIKPFDHLFVLQPKLAKHRWAKKLPKQNTIDHLIKVHSDHSCALTHPGDDKHPSLTYLQYEVGLSCYEMLTLAKDLYKSLKTLNPSNVAMICNDQSQDQRNAFGAAVTAAGHAYLCPLTVFKKKKKPAKKARKLALFGCDNVDIKRLKAEANGNNLARVLAALPPNVLNAQSYINLCQDLARQHAVEYELFDQGRLKRLGANAFLAVAQANPHANAGIVRLRHQGSQEKPWLSLVGKGVCFDTGGVNLKDASGMQEMHEDMQGSSVALGSFLTLKELRPNDTIECWLAITENRLDGDAYTPTEIITAANGTTIEVVHTDAEGRMALADTLHLASQQHPELMIDYATLTGTCVYALTELYTGAFSNRDALHAKIIAAGSASGERTWPFPLDKDFDQLLQSVYADVRQCAISGKGDHIGAARFLLRFVGNKVPWVHLDLSAGHRKGGYAHVPTDVTGFGVRFTCEFVLDQCAHEAL